MTIYNIIIDKQPYSNPSTEKRQYTIKIEELRRKGTVSDILSIESGKAVVTRKIGYYQGETYLLEEPIIEEIKDIDIYLFEGTNYIYVQNENNMILSAEYVIKNEFTDTFPTKIEMTSSINQRANEIILNVNQKFTNYDTSEEVNSKISQKASEINLEVSKKVDNKEFTGANIMLKVNDDTSEAQINADKININGTISANGNFKIDKEGNMECNNGKFKGGKVELIGGTKENPNLKIYQENMDTLILPGKIYISAHDSGIYLNAVENANKHAYLYSDESGGGITLGGNTASDITLHAGTSPKITCYGEIYANSYNYNSKESIKKNIEQFKDSALNIIKNSELYKFNYKTENDADKKHIGFVIGEKYNIPQEVIAKSGNGIDTYTMTSILWKAIQEQQELIEQLQKEIKEMKGA